MKSESRKGKSGNRWYSAEWLLLPGAYMGT